MFNNKKKIINKGFFIFCLCFFIFNLTTWAAPLSSNIVKSTSNSNIEKQARTCEHCYDAVVDEVNEIYSRTDFAGSRCKYCIRESRHLTDVYTLRNVSSCSKKCTYELIEHLPTEYRCKSIR